MTFVALYVLTSYLQCVVVALVDKPAYSAHVPVTTVTVTGPDVIPVITGNRPVIHSRQWHPVTSQPDIDIHTAASRGFTARPKVKVKPNLQRPAEH